MALGIESIRAPLLALRAARAAATLDGRRQVEQTDLALAARLVLGPRATCLPPVEPPQPQPDSEPPPPLDDTASDAESAGDRPLADVVLEAALATLPPDLLARLSAMSGGRIRSRAAGRAGQIQASLRRGRPIGTRQGELRSGTRLHVMETLKAAAPWQKLRRQAGREGAASGGPGRTPPNAARPLDTAMTIRGAPPSPANDPPPSLATGSPLPNRIEVRRDDFRIVRFRQRTETTTVFAVDASGSAALHRLGEAKGAVELLLADCYVRRDQVALIAFRGREASLLLPPTGSLVRAKRCLAALPGGGATPLAAGIDAATALADTIRRRGRTPVITLLTDGRANIGRDGTGGRPLGEAEALESARRLRTTGIAALLVDTSPRPNPFASRLAEAMGARYVPLPYADASALSRAVRAAAAA
jgi:magnesium chelatase subunit D